MRFFLVFLSVITPLWANVKTDAFVVQVNERFISVLSPEKKRPLFSVLVENRSLSDQIGKFIVEGKNLKFINVKPGETEVVELENKTASNVVFVPLSPAFQEVELIFGKKAYEIPSKK
jgi:hypothetical protein